jgi:hypothetical protein
VTIVATVVSQGTMGCPVCGAHVPDVDGPVHAYVPSAPGCWSVFGEVQADEMQRFGYPPAHRVVADAYMAQHPGDGSDRRDRQSVFVHLVGLCAVLEEQAEHPHATGLLARVFDQFDDFPALRRASGPGALTILHMRDAPDLGSFEQRAQEWAAAVWDSWKEQHHLIRGVLRAARTKP